MTVNLTFNLPAERAFFTPNKTLQKGLRVRVEDKKLMFKPTDNTDGVGVVPISKRRRGGFMVEIGGSMADKIMQDVDLGGRTQLGLTNQKYGWIETHEFEQDTTPKFIPHVRIWPKKANGGALKVATESRGSEKRGPGRPRKKTDLRAALSNLVLLFLNENPDFVKENASVAQPRRKTKSARKARAATETGNADSETVEPKKRRPRRTKEEMAAFRAEQATKVKRRPGRPRTVKPDENEPETNGHEVHAQNPDDDHGGGSQEEIREDMSDTERAQAASRNAHRSLNNEEAANA